MSATSPMRASLSRATLARSRRARLKEAFLPGAALLALMMSCAALFVLLATVVDQGWSWLTFDFLRSFPSRFAEKAGILSALAGTLWIISLTAIVSIPLGLATAIYLVEMPGSSRWKYFLQLNISNLAGVPSIIYGLLGLAIFVRALAFDRSILAGALTTALLVLPIMVTATVEALKAVPASLRDAAKGLGATRRQIIWSHVLPAAMPGIMTGVILALSRALGESAPLIMIGALSFVAFVPVNPQEPFTVLAIQIFNWAGRPQPEFQGIAAAGIIVLLVLTLGLNAIAVYCRSRFLRKS